MFKKFQTNEKGYLLLESLVTLSVILALLLIIYPLLVDWLVLRDNEKQTVEQTRVLYETSMTWSQAPYTENIENYRVTGTPTSLTVSHNNRNFEVEIYEVNFK